MFKAIAFDLDGVITDTAEYHFLAWQQLGDKLGIPFDREFNEQLKGISRGESLELILKLGHKENDYTEEQKLDFMTWKNDIYINLIQEITQKDILPGIQELLIDCQKNNVKMAIASASKNAPMILEKLGIIDFFSVIIDPTTLKNGKPFPDIFIASAKKLNLDVSEIIGIEDSQAGITSINDADMFSVGVGNLINVDYLVSNTNDLSFDTLRSAFDK